ncbi:hypothetical protein DFH06DRAFT_1407183 [Mycena polygramma]|nr:hypothetical protein DFH06DRAFT_1131005 [Mycena polygramma]KAJ7658720.1 hypothetical protein DFH06DRAFT_1407183 [Mycena polygramma]
MAPKTGGKRSAPPTLAPSKRRKLAPTQKNKPADGPKKYTIKPKEKGKEKAADRGTIPIPSYASDEDLELSDHDLEVLQEYGGAASFLNSLDQAGISRSKKETERLHRLDKPLKKSADKDDLPSLDSHDEDEGAWDSDLPSDGEDATTIRASMDLGLGRRYAGEAHIAKEAVEVGRRAGVLDGGDGEAEAEGQRGPYGGGGGLRKGGGVRAGEGFLVGGVGVGAREIRKGDWGGGDFWQRGHGAAWGVGEAGAGARGGELAKGVRGRVGEGRGFVVIRVLSPNSLTLRADLQRSKMRVIRQLAAANLTNRSCNKPNERVAFTEVHTQFRETDVLRVNAMCSK